MGEENAATAALGSSYGYARYFFWDKIASNLTAARVAGKIDLFSMMLGEKKLMQWYCKNSDKLQSYAPYDLDKNGKMQADVETGEIINKKIRFSRETICHHRKKDVVRIKQTSESNSVVFSDLFHCGSVWACPVCGAKIQQARVFEIQQLFKWIYNNDRVRTLNPKNPQGKLMVFMLTLTAPHTRFDGLNSAFYRMKKATHELSRCYDLKKFYKQMGLHGKIKATELTHGANGWHLHFHYLIVVNQQNRKVVRGFADVYKKAWEKACLDAGLISLDDEKQMCDFKKHSVLVSVGNNGTLHESDYLSKYVEKMWASDELIQTQKGTSWGAEKEIGSFNRKVGHFGGHRSPMEILYDLLTAKNQENKKRDVVLWFEYLMNTKRRNQLSWSKGLKTKIGLLEKTDEDLCEEKKENATIIAGLLPDHWTVVNENAGLAALKNAAENNGYEGVKKYFKDICNDIVEPLLPAECDCEDDEISIDKIIAGSKLQKKYCVKKDAIDFDDEEKLAVAKSKMSVDEFDLMRRKKDFDKVENEKRAAELYKSDVEKLSKKQKLKLQKCKNYIDEIDLFDDKSQVKMKLKNKIDSRFKNKK